MATNKIVTLANLTYYDQKLKAWAKTLSATHVEFVSVQALPQTGDTNKIYLVPNSNSGTNIKDEYIWLDGKWEPIGSTAAELSGYVKTTDLTNTLKSYAKSEDLDPINANIDSLNLSIDELHSKDEELSKYIELNLITAQEYADSLASNYATAEQGEKADTAVQPEVLEANMNSLWETLANNYATRDSLDNYVTKHEIETSNYVTNSQLDNYATRDLLNEFVTNADLNNKGYLIESDLNNLRQEISTNYLSKDELDSKDYVTNSDLNGKGYVTGSFLQGIIEDSNKILDEINKTLETECLRKTDICSDDDINALFA